MVAMGQELLAPARKKQADPPGLVVIGQNVWERDDSRIAARRRNYLGLSAGKAAYFRQFRFLFSKKLLPGAHLGVGSP